MAATLSLAQFTRLPPRFRARVESGLSGAIDQVADAAPPSRSFLRYQWYAAALAAYGGSARTVLVEDDAGPAVAMPLVGFGPGPAKLASVPGCYWPFRAPVARADADVETYAALLDAVAGECNAIRIGPVAEDDAVVAPLLAAARAKGWATLDRHIATSWVLDMSAFAEGQWPRNSTLKKNRFHEKHLAAHGALDWRFETGSEPFHALAEIEQRSWITDRTDGSDAKFTQSGHGKFWRIAAQDPHLAAMFRTALLTVDETPAAFSFDIQCGDTRYAVANSYVPDYAKHSPGKLLYWRNLTAARAEGVARIDWGMGDSGYKQVIGATQGAAMHDWLLLRPGLPAILGSALREIWRRSGS